MRRHSTRSSARRRDRRLSLEPLESRMLLSVGANPLSWGGTVISDSGGWLYTINPKAGSSGLAPKLLGPASVVMEDLAFSRDNTLYGVSTASNTRGTSQLYRIDVANYAAQYPSAGVKSVLLKPIYTAGGGQVVIKGLEFDVDTLYAVGEDKKVKDHAVFTIDIATGTATRVASLNVVRTNASGQKVTDVYRAAGDIEFAGPRGNAWITTVEGRLLTLRRSDNRIVPADVSPALGDLQGLTYGPFTTNPILLAYRQRATSYTTNRDVYRLDQNGPQTWQYYGTMSLSRELYGAAFVQFNSAPLAGNDSFSVAKNGVLTVDAASGVLKNDYDPDGDPITAKVKVQPRYGTLTLNANGSFTYRPAANYYGTDSFSYAANDGITDSAPATVQITVIGSSPPLAQADRYLAAENTALSVPISSGVLLNDINYSPGTTLTAVLQSGPSHGQVTLNANGSFSYTPANGFHGTDSFTYQAYDTQSYSNTATVTINVYRPLGAIGLGKAQAEDPTARELWYQFQTTRAGYVTVEASTSSASMTLYNANFQAQQTSAARDGRQRIGFQASGAGQVYYVKLTGTVSGIDLTAVNLVSLSGQAVTVAGTDGDDHFQFDAATREVTIDGVRYNAADFGTAITSVQFDSGPGSNSAQINGGPEDETVSIYPSSATYSNATAGLTVSVKNVNTTIATGGGGTDTASLYDSPGDDQFVGMPTYGELTDAASAQFRARAEGFAYVHAYAVYGGTNTAYLWGADSGANLYASPAYGSRLSGTGYFNRAKGFTYVHAYGSTAPGHGPNVANLYGTTGNDTFTAYPTYAALSGPGLYVRVKYFDAVYADATQGGTDTAYFYDSPGNDTFSASPAQAQMSGPGFLNRGTGLEKVYAYATAGGVDEATLEDSSGNDALTSTPQSARLTLESAAMFWDAFGFESVKAKSTAGTDTAQVDPAATWLFLDGPWVT